MSPRPLDPESVRRRLAEIDQMLGWLGELGDVSGDSLRGDWRQRLLTERLLGQIVEMAVAINLHVARALGEAVPEDYRRSFGAAAQAGLITEDLAARLAPSAGLRNIVVHDYMGVDLDVVASAVPLTLEHFAEYRRQAARWLANHVMDEA